jgi:FK506-binding nuclear protein
LDEDSESDEEGYEGEQLEYDLSPDEDELDEISESEDDALDGLQDPRITEVGSDDEEAPKLVTKKGKNKRPAESSDVEEPSLDALMSKDAKTAAPATNGEQKLSKKQAKKLKKNDGQAVAAAQEPAKKEKAEVPGSDKKKVQFAKNLELGPTGFPKVEDKKDAKKEAPKGPRVVQGVTIEDKKEGKGRAAKKGDKIEMRYIGKLKNGKQFDCTCFMSIATNPVLTSVLANKKGKPFSFKLGVGEVIKGWDIGVMGMTAGSERRLSIPAKHAYGNKALPDIPANSELIFDIKCISVS